MKVLLFTHKSDIDGMGSVVLSKLAFKKVEYVLCETFNLDNEIEKYFNLGTIYSYDKIFITDLYPKKNTMNKIEKDEELKDKVFIFDHHKSALDENPKKYLFSKIKISDDDGLCCGTSLFFEFLLNSKLLNVENKVIQEFCELTRRYDTWEWKTKYNDETAHKLSLLFDSVGCDGYIELMFQKLKGSNNHFEFNQLEEMLIKNKINQVNEKINNYSKKIYYKEICGLKAGIVFIDYEYRNDLAEYFTQYDYDMDFAMMISLDNETISYRSVKKGVIVRIVAEAMGGKGHDRMASSPISKTQKDKLIEILTVSNV